MCAGEGIDEAAVLDLLTSLADKSLVVAEERNGATRYRMLETVRQYARDRLLESGEGRPMARPAPGAFPRGGRGGRAAADGTPTSRRGWTGWRRSTTTCARRWRGLPPRARMPRPDCGSPAALWRFWEVRGYLGEGRGWLAALLAAAPAGPSAARANALNGAGIMAWQQADYSTARVLQESLAIRRELGDRQGISGSLNNLGKIAYDQGDFPAARALLEESLAIKRELGEQRGIAGKCSTSASWRANRAIIRPRGSCTRRALQSSGRLAISAASPRC